MAAGTLAESDHVVALHGRNPVEGHADQSFMHIKRLAKSLTGMSIAAVALIEQDSRFLKSLHGAPSVAKVPETSICSHAVAEKEPLIVPDTLSDPRFRNHPAVIGDPHVRAYVGVPLRTESGQIKGALCVMDAAPRTPSNQQVELLVDLARVLADELELRLLASVDSLTGAMSRRAFRESLGRDIARAQRYEHPLSCVMLDLDHFKSINDTHGHHAGDEVLRWTIATCKSRLRASDYIGRLGGEEFAIVLPETPSDLALVAAERLRSAIAAGAPFADMQPPPVTASFGVASLNGAELTPEEILRRADVALYAAKRSGRNRCFLFEMAAGLSKVA